MNAAAPENSLSPNPPPPDDALRAWIGSLEEELFSAGASMSEQAFSIGCSASMIPMSIILLLTFLFGNRSWTGLAITAIIILLLALALVNIFAVRARSGAIQRVYQETVWPQIQAHLAEHQLSLPDFQQATCQALPQEALLIKLLSNSPSIETNLAKE